MKRLALSVLLLLIMCQAALAQLTGPQLTTLKTDITAKMAAGQPLETVAASAPGDSDANTFIAAYYNVVATPSHWVWRTSVTKGEFTNSVGPEGTTFSWTGAGFISRSQGERDAWRELFNGTNSVNPSLPNVRAAFTDIFSGGTAPAPANRAHLAAVGRRLCKRGERLFVVGPGDGTTATPNNMGFEGSLTYQQVEAARTLP